MNTYYRVKSTVYDSGKVTIKLAGTVTAENKPCTTLFERNTRDEYEDYFSTIDEAKAFMREVRTA